MGGHAAERARTELLVALDEGIAQAERGETVDGEEFFDQPAWVCSQCGEPSFEAREVEVIQNALTAIDQQMAQLTVDPA